MEIIKNIFGKNIKIVNTVDDIEKYLIESIELYPGVNEKDKIELDINIVNNIDKEFYEQYNISRNPSIIKYGIHEDDNNVSFFEFTFGRYWKTKILYLFEKRKIKSVYVVIPKLSNAKLLLEKLVGIQFLSYKEYFGQVLHELILVPLTYFFEDINIVHGSSFELNGKGIIIGGTGGVGKTSLEIYFAQNYNIKFLADDISIIDNKGYLYLNANYPKIYGYNLENNSILKKQLFNGKNLIDKLFWNLHFYIRGKNRVRRRISPLNLSNNIKQKTKLNYYFILNRTNKVKEVTISKLSNIEANNISNLIIKTEYFEFEKNYNWFVINQLINASKYIIKPKNNIELKSNCYLINIPDTINNHKNNIENIGKLIYKLIN